MDVTQGDFVGCNANNHPSNCKCGFGGDTGGAGAVSRLSQHPTGLRFEDIRSYTNPNALCPECGAPVFYYQSPYGGRVFFNELGPPWPKHPCTDNGRPVSLIIALVSSPTQPPSWESDGWMPITFSGSARMERLVGWYVRYIYIIERKDWVAVLTATPMILPTEYIASFDGFDKLGYGSISIIDLAHGGPAQSIEVYDDRFFDVSPFEARGARQRALPSS